MTTPTPAPAPTSERQLTDLPHLTAYASILFGGAIFGFFYAWICSTMWGLDDADPRVAISAMQAMNNSVRNAVFFPAFFLTPVVMGGTAFVAHRHGRPAAARWFAIAAAVYAVGGMALTGIVNVPMNNDLGDVVVPDTIDAAAPIWDDYSGRWQLFNVLRTIASGVSLALAAVGLASLSRPNTSTA